MTKAISKLLQLIIKPNNLGYHDLLLRLFVGATMIYHGQGKLFNLDGTAMFFSKVGIEPAYIMAFLASTGEIIGGLLIMIGLFTRLGSVILALSMAVAFFTLTLPHGFDIRQGGSEYVLTLFVVFAFICVNGAGRFSFDNIIYRKTNH